MNLIYTSIILLIFHRCRDVHMIYILGNINRRGISFRLIGKNHSFTSVQNIKSLA